MPSKAKPGTASGPNRIDQIVNLARTLLMRRLIALSPFKLDVSYQLDVQAPPDRGPPEKEITFDPSYSQLM
jgi:hypothetical protein